MGGGPIHTDVERLIRRYQESEPFSSEDAFRAAKEERQRLDRLTPPGRPRNLNLRDAEHALFAQTVLDQSGPLLGRLQLLTDVPAYSALKALTQTYAPSSWNLPGQRSTPPDFSELYWGLAPVWGRRGPMPQRGTSGP